MSKKSVNSAHYSVTLCDKLKPVKQGLLSKVVLLWHDNGHTYITLRTVETLKQLHFEMLRHPPYSPDASSLDY
jgi:hypothetical protein